MAPLTLLNVFDSGTDECIVSFLLLVISRLSPNILEGYSRLKVYKKPCRATEGSGQL